MNETRVGKQTGLIMTYITITPLDSNTDVADISSAIYEVAKNKESTIYTNNTANENTIDLVYAAFESLDDQCNTLIRNRCDYLDVLNIEMQVDSIYTFMPNIYCYMENEDTSTLTLKQDSEDRFVQTKEVNAIIEQILHKALDEICEVEIEFHNRFETQEEFLERVTRSPMYLRRL